MKHRMVDYVQDPTPHDNISGGSAKLNQTGWGKGHVTYFLNFGTPYISRELLKLETSNLE